MNFFCSLIIRCRQLDEIIELEIPMKSASSSCKHDKITFKESNLIAE